MKKLVNTISPYLLLMVPVFIGLLVLLFNPDTETLQNSIELNASFIKVPHINLFNVVLSLFKAPLL